MNVPRIYCPLCLTPISPSGLSPGNPCQCPSCDYIFKPSFIAQPITLREKIKNVFDNYQVNIVITPFFSRFLTCFLTCLLVIGVFIWSDVFFSPRPDKLDVKNLTFYTLQNQLRIEGDIKNPSTVAMPMPPLTIIYQDERGEKVAKHKVQLDGVLGEEETKYFIAYVPLPTADARAMKIIWERTFIAN